MDHLPERQCPFFTPNVGRCVHAPPGKVTRKVETASSARTFVPTAGGHIVTMPSLARRFGLRSTRQRDRVSGQSLVEFALVLPALLLIVLVGLDFGRIYLGYINLQQMARIAANYAADNAGAWDATPDSDKQDRYQELIDNDARAINCDLPRDGSGNLQVPEPEFPNGFDLGDPAEVRLECTFVVATPIIGQVLGADVEIGAGATFPIKEGVVSTVPGGGGGGGSAPDPVAAFVGSPRTGYAPLEVEFTDLSLNGPTGWSWSFGNGTASSQGPHAITYECIGDPGDTCSFDVSLTVSGSGASDTTSETAYVVVTVPPATGPIAEFQGTPTSGTEPIDVNFDFLEVTTGVTYTAWEWDFQSDGTVDATTETATYTYADPGSYNVTLTVTDDAGQENTLTKTGYIVVAERLCTVPDFFGVKKNSAQALWEAEGFSTTVAFEIGSGNYIIKNQSLLGGTIDPQPNGCDSTITVGP